ncbi:GTP-binding protein [Streptomyces sp. XD-27]|uniref:CobW family GTP-binding protein n=1 Tax=Streptomyces sp. XD-27 TaxID=3062779 RepID=UPI0026F466B0|nr:CobW family GTP-binding protein [Streptomyces sp. XD-27]WKX68719.1 GTP-binding protein [Streptomyces sp. XD-27]
MATHRIPVVLIAGFLGSGKTTVLNHLLRVSRDTRIGVIVNDFGSINIDALAVAGQVDSMVPIENGCLCCAADAEELDRMLDRLADPAARIDVIVIEASGLAEPQSMIRMLLASTDERVTYGGLVEVVDAAEFDGTRARHPELDRHIRAADAVILNKADRVGGEQRQRLLETLRTLAPGAPVVVAEHGRVDPGFLFDQRPRTARTEPFRQLSFADLWADGVDEADGTDGAHHDDDHDHDHGHGAHLHAAYESVEFSSGRPLHPRRFMEFLDSRPAGLYRMKGFVDFAGADRPQKFALHAVGSYLRFRQSAWERDEPRATQLVMIGAGIDAAALKDGLGECVEPAPETVEEHHMLGVLRYVQQDQQDQHSEPDEPAAYAEPVQHTEQGASRAPGQ